jgi:hypothetical protein
LTKKSIKRRNYRQKTSKKAHFWAFFDEKRGGTLLTPFFAPFCLFLTLFFRGPISWGPRSKNKVKNGHFWKSSYGKTCPSPMVCDFCQKFHWAFYEAKKRLFRLFHFFVRLWGRRSKNSPFLALFR